MLSARQRYLKLEAVEICSTFLRDSVFLDLVSFSAPRSLNFLSANNDTSQMWVRVRLSKDAELRANVS